MKIKYIFKLKIIKYIIAGVVSYLIEISTLLSIHKIFKISVLESAAIAFWIGLLTSFVVQKFFTFNNYHKKYNLLAMQVIQYSILVLVNYVFTLIVVYIFPQKYIIFSRTLALIITTGWNYIVYKRIFKNEVVIIQ